MICRKSLDYHHFFTYDDYELDGHIYCDNYCIYCYESEDDTMEESILEKINKWAEERKLFNNEFNLNKQTSFLTEEITELLRANSDSERVDAFCDIIVFATNAIKHLGYNPDIAMEETLKEISSRTGEFNSVSGKWEKYTDDKAKSLWYQANYDLAKIK